MHVMLKQKIKEGGIIKSQIQEIDLFVKQIEKKELTSQFYKIPLNNRFLIILLFGLVIGILIGITFAGTFNEQKSIERVELLMDNYDSLPYSDRIGDMTLNEIIFMYHNKAHRTRLMLGMLLRGVCVS